MHYFHLENERKNSGGNVLDADAIASIPRVKQFEFSYLSAEVIVINGTAKIRTQDF